jgi:hypothetical protein
LASRAATEIGYLGSYTEILVNKRAITWFVAALLALAGAAVAPAANVRTRDAATAIVWVAQEHAEQRIPIRVRVVRSAPALVRSSYEAPARTRIFAAFLYQRPPPSLR